MGATPDFNRPTINNPVDADLDFIRANQNFLISSCANGMPTIPGWNTQVNISLNNNFAQPDGYVLTKGTRAIHVLLTWTTQSGQSPIRTIITQVQLGWDDGVSSPGLVLFDPVTLTVVEATTPIKSGLGAWYKLDETSGTRVNSHVTSSPNLYDMLEDVSVGNVAGVLGNAADFIGNPSPHGGILFTTENNSTDLMSATTIAGCCWAKTDVEPTGTPSHIIGRGNFSGDSPVIGDKEWAVMFVKKLFVSPELTGVRIGGQGPSLNRTVDSLDVPIVPGTYYFIYWYWDVATQVGGVSVNDGTIYNTAVDDPIGAQHDTINMGLFIPRATSDTNRLDGAVDEVGLWHGRILSATDVTNLYNGGAGVTYADLTWSS